MGRLIRSGFLILVAFFLCTASPALSQPAKRADYERLSLISAKLTRESNASRLAAESLAVRWEMPLISVDTSWTIRELIGVRNGRPVFYQTHNRSAALSIGTAALQMGGRSGLDLTGSDLTIGLWDGGAIRLDHVEFGGRASQKDRVIQTLNHSTHVAGTLIAAGVLASARGMATEALLEAYDWNNDAAEMADAAASGLSLSNHSYGSPAGWVDNLKGDGFWGWLGDPSIDPQEDYRFGHYDAIARTWDEIAAAAPTYLIVKSAGNERADRGPNPGAPHYVFESKWILSTTARPVDGGATGFDTILDGGVSKNVLTVGAVEDLPWGYSVPDDVVMTDFSGWGPTDDGRIKPDLVANGVQLMSSMAWAADGYGTSSGSSMAAPGVTGTAGLLGVLYKTTHQGTPLLSSTLRALLIHTADEAGPAPGPDYRFGWGLVNAERAAAIILADSGDDPGRAGMIVETVLSEGTSFELPIHIEPGDPIRVTLAWTDPPAILLPVSLDQRTRRLVNDLELEVTGPDGTLLPWTLDPEDPEAPAASGVNGVDNVEQVVLDLASGGDYVVHVYHSGALASGLQSFSIVLGEPDIERTGNAVFTVSGTVHLSGIGMNRVPVRLSGLAIASTETTPDGTYAFSGVPPGTYTVTALSDLLSFREPAKTVTLTTEDARLDFEAVSPLSFDGYSLFDSQNLLQPDELGGARFSASISAGGVYGCTLLFSTPTAGNLSGGRVVLDWSFDPYVAPFIGMKANEFLDLGRDWVMTKSVAGRLHKRIPALWVDPASPLGYTARIPFRVYAKDESLILADTLDISVDRSDDVAPGIFPIITVEGRGYAPPGGELGISVALLDGSPIISVWAHLLRRDDESSTIASIPLFDSGDLGMHWDEIEGDGLFSGVFVPPLSAEYRLSVSAEDASGNRATRVTDIHYSATPFVRASDVLLLARNERASATNLHRETLNEIGVPHEFWEFTVRGQMPREIMNAYPIVVWSLHGSPLTRQEDKIQLISYLESGGRLILLGEQLVSGTVDTGWLEDEFGVLSVGRAPRGGIASGLLQPAFYGFTAALREDSRAGLFQLQNSAIPVLSLLDQKGGKTGVIGALSERGTGRLFVAGISLASLAQPTARRELMRRFLFGISEDVRFLPDPETVDLLRPADGASDTAVIVEFDWSIAPLMSYRLQLSDRVDFSDLLLADTTVSSPPVQVHNLVHDTHYYWRIRAENQKGLGVWSTPYSFQTERLNAPPFVASFISDQLLAEGESDSLIPLSGIFSDPDGDPLTLSAASSDTTVVSAEIRDGVLVLTPVGPGSATIEIRAEDAASESAHLQFEVTVLANSIPAVTESYDDILILVSADPLVWDLSLAFGDEDGDALSYAASSSNPSVAMVRVEGKRAILTAIAIGASTVTFSADDERGGFASTTFVVTVRSNAAPIIAKTLFDIEMLISADSISVDLADFLSDPDDDPISYLVESDPEGIVGATLSGSRLLIRPRAPGRTTIEVVATDIFGFSVMTSFRASVRTQAALSRVGPDAPTQFSLRQNYPNPLREQTTFVFEIPEPSHVRLTVYSILGTVTAVLLSGPLEPGRYTLDWMPRTLASGVYAYRLEAGGFAATRLLSIVN